MIILILKKIFQNDQNFTENFDKSKLAEKYLESLNYCYE